MAKTPSSPASAEPITKTATDLDRPNKKGVVRKACLVVIYGTDLGRRVPLSRSTFTVGRSSKNDLSLDQDSVSRHHARVTFDKEGYAIADLDSKNGTYVNDAAVTRTVLRHGDQVKIGRSILKFMEADDIEANYHEEIYRLMTVDGLTQIYNKRYFTEALEREWGRVARYKRGLSLLLFDLDHFKKINDAFGHVAGDSVLRQLSTAVKTRLREQDIFARVGGEEFAVLLPEVASDGARATAEKVRAVVESTGFDFEKKKIPCTVSLGCAASMGKADAAALYAASDAALYRAKSSGRNCVVVE